MIRRKAREAAFKMLFQAEGRFSEVLKGLEEEIALFYQLQGGVPHRQKKFVRHLVEGTLRNREELDRAIESAGSNWRLDRMGRSEKTLLRMGIFEYWYGDQNGEEVPREIVIDEVVELAKIYAGEEAAAFVNGVLDAVARRFTKPSARKRETV
ncbi:MAG: transcription antitermination factor NusB [Candidatus Hydrogenedentota bacterium]|nr:MAG: transcription antitermination factor NusB [Candidatus Hydrogenedentota bacterium]